MKTCRCCKLDKVIEQFKKLKKSTDGRDTICKRCHNKANRPGVNRYNHTPPGLARNAWHSLNRRAKNSDGKHPTYADVEVKMTKSEFMTWAIPAYKKWLQDHPGVTPTVDRSKSEGHYELSNIELASRQHNSGRANRCQKSAAQLAAYVLRKCDQFGIDPLHLCTLLTNKEQ